MRSEDDLRAAFTAKAGEAPSADRVARAVRQAEARPRDRRRWLAPAIGLAAAAAVGVPLALAISHSSTNSKNANSGNLPQAPAAGSAGGASSAAGAGSAESRQSAAQQPGVASPALCRPADVVVSVRREAGNGSLLVTSRGPACRIARTPSLRWPSGSTTFGTQQDSTSGNLDPAIYGVLPSNGVAHATVQWNGCGLPGGSVVYVDWGSGPVRVRVDPAPPPSGCAKTPAPTDEPLRVLPLSGLS